MPRIQTATPLDDYKVRLTFDDGVEGVVDLSGLARRGVFSIWDDYDTFRAVGVGEYGELSWSDAIDLCPDALYLEVTGKRPEELFSRLRSERVDA